MSKPGSNVAGPLETDSLQLFRIAAEQSPAMIVITDVAGRIEYVNPRFEEITGYRANEVQGLNPRILKSGEQSPEFYGQMWTRLRAGEIWKGEFHNRRKDGSLYWESASISSIKAEDGAIAHYVAIKEDVTEKKRSEANLEALARMHVAILENAGYAIIATDAAGVITILNPAAERLTGYPAGEMIGLQTPQILHVPEEVVARAKELSAELGREISPGWEVFIAKALLGLPNDSEWTFVRKDGSTMAAQLSVTAIRDGDGVLTGTLGLFSDISARKKTEQAIAASRDQLMTFVRHAPSAVAMFDRDLRYLICSQRWLDDYQLTEQTVTGRSHYEVFPDLPERWKAIHRRCLGGVMERCEEDFFELGDGSRYWLRWEVAPWRDADGNVCGLIMASENITRLKNSEIELQAANEGLEAALERMEELARKANEGSKAKSEFLANMSHEIRTPMNGVIGMTDLLMETALSLEQLRYVETIQTSADALLATINDVLDFSKIEARQVELEELDFDSHYLVSSTADMLAVTCRSKLLVLETRFAPEVPRYLLGDPTRLRQVLLNLGGNAVKFTDAGSIRISVSREGDDLRFEVSDTGAGISPEQAAHLFRPFSQADSSTTRIHGGSGLGLAISKNLVELMGGRIGLDSTPGVGSAFWFTVPCREGKALPPEQDLSAPEGRKPENLRVLLVEDNATNQKVALAVLSKLGCETRAVANGQAAIEALAAHAYDVVLMDCQMPVMDGYEATRRIRAGGTANARIPIIAMTANAVKGDRELCLAAGMSDYLSKPIHPRDLSGMLARWSPVAPGS